ncbi:MAG: alpha amylase C-terminal domain-containing protein [Desulfobacterales bacterium]|nr:alpha amylase C-terminal domain-containing protein [Desulfobacterales bacterium]
MIVVLIARYQSFCSPDCYRLFSNIKSLKTERRIQYYTILDTDREVYGGFNRQDLEVVHHTINDHIHRHFISIYIPSRTALILDPLNH